MSRRAIRNCVAILKRMAGKSRGAQRFYHLDSIREKCPSADVFDHKNARLLKKGETWKEYHNRLVSAGFRK